MKIKLQQNSNIDSKLIELIKRILKDCDDFDKSQVSNKEYEGVLSESTGVAIKLLLPELYNKYFA